jgi:hypothetical protein
MNPSNPNHHRQTTSLVTGAGHYRHCIEAQTRWSTKKFVHTTRLPTAWWTSGPTTKPAPPPTRDPNTSATPHQHPAVTVRTNLSQVGFHDQVAAR